MAGLGILPQRAFLWLGTVPRASTLEAALLLLLLLQCAVPVMTSPRVVPLARPSLQPLAAPPKALASLWPVASRR